MRENGITIQFGALAPKMSEQLAGRISPKEGKRLDHLAHSLDMVRIHGIITDVEAEKARKRLMKKIQEAIWEHTNP